MSLRETKQEATSVVPFVKMAYINVAVYVLSTFSLCHDVGFRFVFVVSKERSFLFDVFLNFACTDT